MVSIVAAIVAVAVTVFASLMTAEETAVAFIAPGRALRLSEAGRAGGPSLERLSSAPHRLRAAAALARAIAYVVVGACASWVLAVAIGLSASATMLAGGFVGVVWVFSLAETLPRTVATQNPENVALTFASIARRGTGLLYPPARLLGVVWTFGMRLAVGEEASPSPWVADDDYRSTVDDEQAGREEAEEALLEAVSDFSEKVVREVMVPRTDMTCIEDTTSAKDAIATIEAHGYSRLPVYHETLDDIRGVLYAKDLLAAIGRDPGVRPVSIARRAYFVPETKPVSELLIEMQERTHIAIVADEYGGTAGLVTIEDLLEEIVGEIRDEYDRESPLVVELDDERTSIDARLPVDDLNERFGTAIESDADTVGGVVIEIAGRIPQMGDTVEIEGLRFIVEELEGTRIRKLVVESVGSQHREEGDDA